MSDNKGKYKKKDKLGAITQQLFDVGKMPPQAVDLEEAVLGACLLDAKNIVSVLVDMLKPESFYKEVHQRIYKMMLTLYAKSEPIDILTITQALRGSGELEIVGGAYYISILTNRISSSANTEVHARIIQQKFMERELIRMCSETIKTCYDGNTDVFDILSQAQSYLNGITSDNIRSQEKGSTAIFSELIKHIEHASLHKEELTGVPCTINEINKVTNGWQKSDLWIVGARPAVGKTSFTKACIRGAIAQNMPVAMFSLEMSTKQLSGRLMSEDTDTMMQSLMNGKFEQSTNFGAINSSITRYFSPDNKDLLFIDDTAYMTIMELKARAYRMYNKHKIKLIIVDYLQLLHGSDRYKGNRVLEIDEISMGLKAIAKDLDIPVIALSQLGREVEKAHKKRPSLAHLRESGGIEANADGVILLYRPEVYAEQGEQGFDMVEYKGVEIPSAGFSEAIIAKHRNGAVATIPMLFTGRLTRFSDWEQSNRDAQLPPPITNPTPPIDQPVNGGGGNKMPENTNFMNEKKDENKDDEWNKPKDWKDESPIPF